MTTFTTDHVRKFFALYTSERNEVAGWLGISRELPEENDALYAMQGTAFINVRGKPRAKLTPQQAIEIRSLKGNLSQDKIAERFGVSHSTVAKIHRGELWRSQQP